MLSLIGEKRSLPLYWRLLDKKGSSNICEQQALITPVLDLLSDYEIVLMGEREFGNVKLASWLCHKQVKFIFRVKQGRYIKKKMLIIFAYVNGSPKFMVIFLYN
jgi:hypothetical protein